MQRNNEPAIEFSVIPPKDEGGRDTLATIEGYVINARPGQQIVLYARSGDWYIQPFIEEPFTKIEADSKWRNSTHLGTEYAALLVEPNYTPPNITGVLPNKDNKVVAVTVVRGTPEFWESWWFRTAIGIACVFLLIVYFRLRMVGLTREMNVRFEERLAERTRIAQELHDSLLQGFVGISMQINIAVEQLPKDSPAKPQLERTVKLIGQVIEEGRNTVQGLRSSPNNVFASLEQQFSELWRNLDVDGRIDFRIIVEGTPKPFYPPIADEIYHICRETLLNAFRHSKADKVEIEMKYAAYDFKITVRDNGIGIKPQILESGRKNHWGLSGMKERAEKIGAKLEISSREKIGTKVELSAPNHIAFETQNSIRPLKKWLAKLNFRRRN